MNMNIYKYINFSGHSLLQKPLFGKHVVFLLFVHNFLVGWRPLQENIVTSQFSGGVKITQNRAGIGKGEAFSTFHTGWASLLSFIEIPYKYRIQSWSLRSSKRKGKI